MVLMFTLFGAVFSSVVWFVYAVKFILSSLGGMSFFDAGLLNVLLYTLFVCLPEFVIWMIFGFINQFLSSRLLSRQMYKLFSQMKKNQEYSDLLARIMLETGENIRNSFMMDRFELFIADMNELLCEIVQRENLISGDQVGELWVKVQNGGKWAFGKILVENYNKNHDFKKKISDDAAVDNILAGTIMEFCARYQSLVGLLEKYDKEKVFLNVIETGVFGKVFSIVASISDDLRRARDIKVVEKDDKKEDEKTIFLPEKENDKNLGPEGISPFQKEFPKIKREKKDEFSLALERSFSSEQKNIEDEKFEKTEHKEPVFTEKQILETSSFEDIPDSQKALDNLKKEWSEIEKKQDNSEDALAYPFGGWIDVDKYQK